MANGLFNLKQVIQAVQQGGWPNQKTPFVEYLVVAGGGGGGSSNGGGGGAGGLLTGLDPVPNGQTLLVTVGAGGNGGSYISALPGYQGANSVFGSITATGGGGGGTENNSTPATSGGSGGGANYAQSSGTVTGSGIAGQGNAGGRALGNVSPYCAGGGGGAGTVGLNAVSPTAGNGGAGIASSINGTVTTYAGGGGGGGFSGSGGVAGSGGVGGGGAGSTGVATNGSANTGGGGGGSGNSTNSAGTGGSGIVIVSYPDVYAAATSTTGSPTVSTSGSGSAYFNGSSYINYAGQSAFAFGSGDFTIEMWFYTPSVSVTQGLYDSRPSGTQGAYACIYVDNGGFPYFYVNSANVITGSALSANTWYQIAVCRSGTVTKMFINGTQSGSSYTDTTVYLNGSSRPTVASLGASGGNNYTGYISNLRVVKGTAVYTSNFTAPTAPLTPITNTSLLLGTVSPNQYLDLSTNSYIPTITGTPTWNQLSPFATGTGYKNRVYTWTTSGSITF
jgi:hypothetical protein